MEMQKLEKIAAVSRQRWWMNFIPPLLAFGIACIPVYTIFSYLTYKGELVWSSGQDAVARPQARLVADVTKENDELRSKNAALQRRLDEMTDAVVYGRSCDVYDTYVPGDAGIYRMEEVSQAYDQLFRSSEMTARCLAKSSAWFKSHPFGIDPEDLDH